MSAVWSLSGGKRTWRLRAPTSEFDPKAEMERPSRKQISRDVPKSALDLLADGIPPSAGMGYIVMTIKTYFAIFAVLSLLFGVGFVLAPGQVLGNYGVENSPTVALMSRLFGGTLLAIAVILWYARDFHDEAAVRAVLIGLLIADIVNFVVATMATMAGTVNALGWSTVLIYLCGAAGAAYFLTAGKAQQRTA
jgi:hypothetical protein